MSKRQIAANPKAQRAARRHAPPSARRPQWFPFEEETGPSSAPVYASPSMDLAHQLAALKKFEEHPFVTNGRGNVLCPVCEVAMLRAEQRENLALHYVCARSGVVFYGDMECLYLCLYPSLDVAGTMYECGAE